MPATDARPIPRRNVAFRVTFPILDGDGDLVSGAAGLDSEISKDGGSFVDCVNESVEISPSSGMYYLDLTSAEMNADTVAIIVKTSTAGAKTTAIVLYPEEPGDVRVDVVQVAGTSQSGGNLNSKLDTISSYVDTEVAAIKAKTDNLPASPAATGDIPTPTAIRTEIDLNSTKLANIQTKVNSLPTTEQITTAILDSANSELSSVPNSTGTIRQFIQFLFAYFRNRRVVTPFAETVYKEDAITVLGSTTLSDDGTSFNKGEMN